MQSPPPVLASSLPPPPPPPLGSTSSLLTPPPPPLGSTSSLLPPLGSASPQRQQLLDRLASFTPARWPGEPLSALECVRRGWRLEPGLRLRCTACRASVCARLPSPGRPRLHRLCMQRLQRLLTDGHTAGCRWAAAPLPAAQLRAWPLRGAAETRRLLAATAARLLPAGVPLPEDAGQLIVPEQHVAALLPDSVYNEQPDSQQRAQLAVQCVLAGWELADSGRHLRCAFGCRVWDPAHVPRPLAAPSELDSQTTTVRRSRDGEGEAGDAHPKHEARVKEVAIQVGPGGVGETRNISVESAVGESVDGEATQNATEHDREQTMREDLATSGSSVVPDAPETASAEPGDVEGEMESHSASVSPDVHIEIEDDLDVAMDGDINKQPTGGGAPASSNRQDQGDLVSETTKRETPAVCAGKILSEQDTASNRSVCGSAVDDTVSVDDVSQATDEDADSECSEPAEIALPPGDITELLKFQAGGDDSASEADTASDRSVRGSVVDLSLFAGHSEADPGPAENVQAIEKEGAIKTYEPDGEDDNANRGQSDEKPDILSPGDETMSEGYTGQADEDVEKEGNKCASVEEGTGFVGESEEGINVVGDEEFGSREGSLVDDEANSEVAAEEAEVSENDVQDCDSNETDEEEDVHSDDGECEGEEPVDALAGEETEGIASADNDFSHTEEEDEGVNESVVIIEDDAEDFAEGDYQEGAGDNNEEEEQGYINDIVQVIEEDSESDECGEDSVDGDSDSMREKAVVNESVIIGEGDGDNEVEEEHEEYTGNSSEDEEERNMDDSVQDIDEDADVGAEEEEERSSEDGTEEANASDGENTGSGVSGDEQGVAHEADVQDLSDEDEADDSAEEGTDADVTQDDVENADTSQSSDDCGDGSADRSDTSVHDSVSVSSRDSGAALEVESEASSACAGADDSASAGSDAGGESGTESDSADTVEYVPRSREPAVSGKRSPESDEASATKRRRRGARGLLEAHRTWCPWVTGVDGAPPGWQQAVAQLADACSQQQPLPERQWTDTAALETMQRVWATLDQWAMPVTPAKREASA